MTTKLVRANYCVSGTDMAMGLHFVTESEYMDFIKEKTELINRHNELLKQRYGIWAPNQNGYVADESQLSETDRQILGMNSDANVSSIP